MVLDAWLEPFTRRLPSEIGAMGTTIPHGVRTLRGGEIEATGGTVLGIEVDVRDHEAVEAMVAQAVAEWGRVDVLVANAGGSWSAHGHQGQHT